MTATTETREREWSVSAAALYRDVCPRQWSYRHGPHKLPPAPRSSSPTPIHLARGKILHAGIAAAYTEAARELATTPGGLAGARMSRYATAARRAIGQAWEAEGQPGDSDDVLEILALMRDLLISRPVPARHGIYAVERRIRARLDSGRAVVAIPDLVLRTGKGTVRVVDWKTGAIDGPAETLRSQQLLVYAWLIAAADHSVTAVEIELHSIRRAIGHPVTPTPAQVADAVNRLDRTAARAEADTECAPRVGPHCTGCPFRQVCPAFGGAA